MVKKYLTPLRECSKVLNKTKGVNYVILVCDEADSSNITFHGGSGWHYDNDPDFFTMIGGLVEHFLKESKLSYMDKLKLLKEFHSEIIEHITNEGENENE